MTHELTSGLERTRDSASCLHLDVPGPAPLRPSVRHDKARRTGMDTFRGVGRLRHLPRAVEAPATFRLPARIRFNANTDGV